MAVRIRRQVGARARLATSDRFALDFIADEASDELPDRQLGLLP